MHNPRRLDVEALCREGKSLGGEFALADLPRLAAGVLALADSGPAETGRVSWSVAGSVRPVAAGAPELWVRLQASTSVMMECQRCLQAMPCPLDVDRSIRFVRGEDEAARLDDELEEDVLALSASLDLQAMVEDELIMALPFIPRHEQCEAGAAASPASADAPAAPAAKHPFAALAPLRRGTR